MYANRAVSVRGDPRSALHSNTDLFERCSLFKPRATLVVVAIGLLAISLPEAALAQVNFDDPKCYGGRVDADSVTGGFRD